MNKVIALKNTGIWKEIYFGVFVLCLVCYVLFAPSVNAAACSETFPDGISSAGNGGNSSITFSTSARIVNSPDGVLATNSLTDNSGGTSCDTWGACTNNSSLSPVPSLDYSVPFGSTNINLISSDMNITAGAYRNVNVGSGRTLRLAPGSYYFRRLNVNGGTLNINLAAGAQGVVRIFVQQAVEFTSNSQINTAGTGLNHTLFLYGRDAITIQADAVVNAVIYAKGSFTINAQSILTGAATTEKPAYVWANSRVVYQPEMLEKIDFGGECEAEARPVLEWLFDEGSGQLINDTAGSLNAGRGSNLTNTDANDPDWVCGYSGAALQYDWSKPSYAASVASFDPPENGSVVFWLKMGSNFGGASNRRVFSLGDGWEIRYDSSRRLYFDINKTGSNTTFASNTLLNNYNRWYHVAAVFNSDNDTYSVYIDGVLDKSGSWSMSPQSANVLNLGRRTWASDEALAGIIDEFRVYDAELTQAEIVELRDVAPTICTINAIDHFDVDVGSGAGSVCAPSQVIITARDSSGTTLTDYTGTVSISNTGGSGDWSVVNAQGALTPGASDSGQATYQFVAADNGQITLALANQHAQTVRVNVSENGGSATGQSSDLTFSENAFVVSSIDALGDDLIAARRHVYQVQMMLRAPGSTECGVASNYNVNTLKAWIQRSAADPSGAAPIMNNATLSANITLLNTAASAQSLALAFNAGTANFSLDTSDVGQYSINFIDDSLAFADAIIIGGSSVYTARPFAFLTTVTDNPEGADASGAVFKAAGQNFVATTRALGWHANDDINDDGRADVFDDGNVNNNDNLTGAVLLSFAKESPAESITLSANLEAPTWTGGGVGPELSSSAAVGDARIISSFTGGVGSTSEVYFPEVGVITLSTQVSDNNYLGSSTSATNKALSPSVYVGRFTPARFEVDGSSSVTEFCSGFSYFDQPWSAQVNLTALNSRDAVTLNYKDSFVKLGAGQINYFAGDVVQMASQTSRLINNATSVTWASGVAAINSSLSAERLAAGPDGPLTRYTLGFSATDTDGITIDSADYDFDSDFDSSPDSVWLGEMQMLFARLRLDSAFGPETESLPVNYVVEYWSGSYFEQATTDSCTTLAQLDHEYPGGSIDVLANRTVAVASGTTTASYANLTATDVAFNGGDAGLVFSAPGASNTGSFMIYTDLTLYPWLRFDWNQDGNFSDLSTPAAEISFGAYRNHDRVIFWQEVLAN